VVLLSQRGKYFCHRTVTAPRPRCHQQFCPLAHGPQWAMPQPPRHHGRGVTSTRPRSKQSVRDPGDAFATAGGSHPRRRMTSALFVSSCNTSTAVFGCRFSPVCVRILLLAHNWKKLWGGSCCLRVSLTASSQTLSVALGTFFKKRSAFVTPSRRQAQPGGHRTATAAAIAHIKENTSTAKAILPWIKTAMKHNCLHATQTSMERICPLASTLRKILVTKTV